MKPEYFAIREICSDEASRPPLTQLLVNHQPSHGKRRKEQTEQDISGVRPILHNVYALNHR
jgi:hypothetical protein